MILSLGALVPDMADAHGVSITRTWVACVLHR
jgi:hypothetical protein